MNDELKNALEALETKLAGANKVEMKNAIKDFKSGLDADFEEKLAAFMKADDETFVELKNQLEKTKELNTEFKTRLAEMEIKLSKVNRFQNGDELEDFATELKASLAENFDEVKKTAKGRNTTLELKGVEIKAVGNMTSAVNLTGDTVKTYQGGVAAVPSQKVNMADLLPTVQSSTGTYVVYRETGAEGAIANQSAPGDAKSQKDYDFTEVVFNATYLSGYARFAKQMAQDLPFLTSFLPMALRRDYFKAENTLFYTALKAAATASAASGAEGIERIIQDIGALENADYDVNGIILNPVDWATIAITKPGDFSLPSVVAYVNGNLVINGIPVFKASFVAADEYIVGDWNMAKKIVTDGLAVEFFEQDADNVTKNLITARVESRTVLGIDRPDAFIIGSITPPT